MHDSEQHDRWVETQTEAEQQELSNDVFISVTSLYAHYLLLDPKIRGRMQYHCGEAKAEPLDFMADVVIKAKRALLPAEYAAWQRLGGDVEASTLLSEEVKAKLRLAWHNLVSGYYQLFKDAQRGWDKEAKRLLRQEAKAKKALDDNAFALYEEERKAAELLETQEEDADEEVQQNSEEPPQNIAA